MGVLSDYDDLAGYEFGEFSDIFNQQTLKQFGIISAAGAAGILATTYGAQWLAKRQYFAGLDPAKRARYLSCAMAGVGIIGAAYLAKSSPENKSVALALAGGAAGLALANLAASFFTTNPLGTPLGEAGDDESMLSSYDFDQLNGLAETVVDPAGNVPQLAGVVVDPASLQGFQPWLS